ncbi:MAG: hypothetical protein AVDCRST_MAG70-1853 [uncultured Thermomicrobiales bacterium]|uniref:Uncharacterized protein n=1 Tax=uncultured Thermomicrobiales bacterium TaxID=1645740 RepID=A0A6J4UYL6_9BACT|nr:MAG: hypothetical protein AVDCRST_MAG70-1853 [uncultured Thermomicrobiales bacterium]
MTPVERLRHGIDTARDRLRQEVPADRDAAILALLRARDRIPYSPETEAPPDPITGRRLADPGSNLALRLCLGDVPPSPRLIPASGRPALDAWADRFLRECGAVAEAGVVLGHVESVLVRLADVGGTTHAWLATRRQPARWRERADIDWWAAWLARRSDPEARDDRTGRPDAGYGDPRDDATLQRPADVHVARMTYQLGYPLDAVLGGVTVQTYRDVVAILISRTLREHRQPGAGAMAETDLIPEIASVLAVDQSIVGRAVTALTLDRDNAVHHAAVPGVAAAPLVRIGSDQLAPSLYGLTTEPFLFLTREVRRRDATAYHNAAHLREDVFRSDLYALFADKRFVTSPGSLKLRRVDGDVRTDIDAAIFDRKSGTLALFELKSQDPFARSAAELDRQRDAFLYARRQVSGVLAWLKHHGADALLARIDARVAKTFRVQKVYSFVLGRHLAHLPDDGPPDHRAAWGTWPQVLRLLVGRPIRSTDANPLASLHTSLTRDRSLIGRQEDLPPRTIAVGTERLIVHPSYAAFQVSAGTDGRSGGPSIPVTM